MAQILKVDEWQSPTGHWYVADVHTWTSWMESADILGVDNIDDYIDILTNKYQATIIDICEYEDKPTLIIFKWDKTQYRFAHQYKLDINRIARKKNYLVERSF